MNNLKTDIIVLLDGLAYLLSKVSDGNDDLFDRINICVQRLQNSEITENSPDSP